MANEDSWAECDACGEMKPEAGGELNTGGVIRPDQIDPPDESWVCADCLAMFEEMEISSAEAKIENRYLEGW